MILHFFQRKTFKWLHPILKRVVGYYLSKPRNYAYAGVKLNIVPGVFHPGLFYSTKYLLRFISAIDLNGKSVLELGAGSGLLSIYCAKQGARVTSSDINKGALEALVSNASINGVELSVRQSDLLDNLNIEEFDITLINPPFYPREPKNVSESAWFCGKDFEYFSKLFFQLKGKNFSDIWMVLSEDCNIIRIQKIAESSSCFLTQVDDEMIGGEKNYIFKIESSVIQID